MPLIQTPRLLTVFCKTGLKRYTPRGRLELPRGVSPTSFPGLRLRPLDYLGNITIRESPEKCLTVYGIFKLSFHKKEKIILYYFNS